MSLIHLVCFSKRIGILAQLFWLHGTNGSRMRPLRSGGAFAPAGAPASYNSGETVKTRAFIGAKGLCKYRGAQEPAGCAAGGVMVRLSDKGWAIHNAWQPLQSLSLYPHKSDALLRALVMQTPDHFLGGAWPALRFGERDGTVLHPGCRTSRGATFKWLRAGSLMASSIV